MIIISSLERKATVYYTGGELTYSFPFSYLKKEFIKVKYVNAKGVTTELSYRTDYTVEDKKIILVQAGSSEDEICIYRKTPTDRLVEFVDASVLKAYNLNNFNIQLLHLAEENYDAIILNGMSYDSSDTTWSGLHRRIKDIEQPINDGDVVTLAYLNSIDVAKQSTILAAMTSTATSEVNAKTYESNAKTSETNAKASADAAKVSESNAKTSETNAKTSESSSSLSEVNAKTSESNSKTSETNVAISLNQCQQIQEALKSVDLSTYATKEDLSKIDLSSYANVADSVLKFPNGGRIWVG